MPVVSAFILVLVDESAGRGSIKEVSAVAESIFGFAVEPLLHEVKTDTSKSATTFFIYLFL